MTLMDQNLISLGLATYISNFCGKFASNLLLNSLMYFEPLLLISLSAIRLVYIEFISTQYRYPVSDHSVNLNILLLT